MRTTLDQASAQGEWIGAAECKTLFNVGPAGALTGHAESLTSYLIRLARAHSVSPRALLSEVVGANDSAIRDLCYGSFYAKHGNTINGAGKYAELVLAAFSQLSVVDSLRFHTLLPWKNLIASQGSPITNASPAWCSQCLAEMLAAGKDPYRMLLWSMAAVQVCPVHRIKLDDRCPCCSKLQPAIPRWPDLAFCDGCRTSLVGRGGGEAVQYEMRDPALRQASIAADLVACGRRVDQSLLPDLWVQFLGRSIKDATEGNRAEFCRHAGFQQRALNKWLSGEKRPALESIIRMMAATGTMPSDAFLKSDGTSRISFAQSNATKLVRAGVAKPDDNLLAKAVAEAADRDDPPTLTALATELGMSRGGLKYRFPVLCARITEQRRTRRTALTKDKIRDQKLKIAAIVREFRLNGIFPGRKRVEAECRKLGFSLIPDELRQVYQEELFGAANDTEAVLDS